MGHLTSAFNTNSMNMSLCSWNMRGHGADRVRYAQSLLENNDIVLVQETWLYDFEFHKLSGNSPFPMTVIGTSGMDPEVIRSGRPYGGLAIIVKDSSKLSLARVSCKSNRLMAVIVNTFNDFKFLLFNVYMPCDERYPTAGSVMYEEVLSEIESIIDTHNDIDNVLVAGDLNTDVNRDYSAHTPLLLDFCARRDLQPCVQLNINRVDFSYENEASGTKSTIDHFIFNLSLGNSSVDYFCLHDGDNMSDHAPICLVLDVPVNSKKSKRVGKSKGVSWNRATKTDILCYKETLRRCLADIVLPLDAMHCSNTGQLVCTCPKHYNDLIEYHSQILHALESAAARSIPRQRKKGLAGWSTLVNPLKEEAILWNKMWIDCGRPNSGWVYHIRRKTRAKYRHAVKFVLKNQDKLSAERMAQALEKNASRDLWQEVSRRKGCASPSTESVDDAEGEEQVRCMFRDKYDELYSSVGYDEQEMQQLSHDVDRDASSICQMGECSSKHHFTASDVRNAMKRLKGGKSDACPGLSSDNFINAGDELCVHLSLFLSALLTCSLAPPAMLESVLVPIPKSRKKSVCDSSNYRSIAISSLIGKILDNLILMQHGDALQTSDLQFGFKPSHSTTQCTMVMNEVVEYYNSRRTPVFVTLLDASKAFDRVHYVKLFRLLLSRSLCPLLVRLLLSMYVRQSLVVRWQGQLSQSFPCRNGIKQGGVLSPVLFCVYMDELIHRLSVEPFGCRIGHRYVGALTYADDVTLLAPTRSAMSLMLKVCESFATDYNVMFNGTKSHTIIHSSSRDERRSAPKPFTLNGSPIHVVPQATHLGTLVGEKAQNDNISRLKRDITIRANSLNRLFGHCSSSILVTLFKSYCSSFYGCPLLNLDETVEPLVTSWKKAIKHLLGLSVRTRSCYIPHLVGLPDLRSVLVSRFFSFYKSCVDSKNPIIKLCTSLVTSTYSKSALAKNLRRVAEVLRTTTTGVADFEIIKGKEIIIDSCKSSDEIMCNAFTILELRDIKLGYLNSVLTGQECAYALIKLCTELK